MIKTGRELAAAAEHAAMDFKTVYAQGAFGWPMNGGNKKRALNAYAFNRTKDRAAAINAATDETFAFDCICFIKALLWDWNGDTKQVYGGAKYQSNGVADIDEAAMLAACTDVSEDFSKIQVGEYLWKEGHCGIYIGNGKAVECTHAWADGVQVTAVYNVMKDEQAPGRAWKMHGKLPYISYETDKVQPEYSLQLSNVRLGDRSNYVRAIQHLLIGNGFDCGETGADGIFGAQTEKAVRSFQTSSSIAADGIVGRNTIARLLGVRES